MREDPRFLPAGDQALVVELGDTIDPRINRRVHGLMDAIERAEVPGVFDLVPTYRSILVYYDPMRTSMSALQAKVSELYLDLEDQTVNEPRTVEMPTLYGGEYGPDLEFVAEHAKLTPQQVIDIHSGAEYLVYMMGFSPGFPYLGGLSERLTTPRLESPRLAIPAGSVGIAESQTGVYPVASPGGWRLIGRSPLRMFDPEAEPPSRLAAGDYVRFVPIASEAEYLKLQESAGKGVHAGYAAQ
jgi:inhibitor of KinA